MVALLFPSRSTLLAGLVLNAAIVAFESWRAKKMQWLSAEQSRSKDDPIEDRESDLIGRADVVQELQSYVLDLKRPIVALSGNYGDGKSSVLNLLEKEIGRRAIVVRFSAWLPGSEGTFAIDLFRDIAKECGNDFLGGQLKKKCLAFARTVSGSVALAPGGPNFSSGLRDLIPVQSQKEEVRELREAFGRVPKPVLVLLDEIDRMQREELLVLLKVLRGTSSIPNTTFVCAFSRDHLCRTLAVGEKDSASWTEYLEKFFPVSVHLTPPTPGLCGRILCEEARALFREQRWFSTEVEDVDFAKSLQQAWDSSLQRVCSNLRKVRLLLNDLGSAARAVAGEVNPLDLLLITFVRRYAPALFTAIRGLGEGLACDSQIGAVSAAVSTADVPLETLRADINSLPNVDEFEWVVGCLFPRFGAYVRKKGGAFLFSAREHEHSSTVNGRRICDGRYFPLYMFAILPDTMFSASRFVEVCDRLRAAATELDVAGIFSDTIASTKTEQTTDFLRKLRDQVRQFKLLVAESLAYAVAVEAERLYNGLTRGSEDDTFEALQAEQLIVEVSQIVGESNQQRVISKAISCSFHDRLAVYLLERAAGRRGYDFRAASSLDVAALTSAFTERMRSRYNREELSSSRNLSSSDLFAIRRWLNETPGDSCISEGFWDGFIGSSRKKLAEAIDFIYPRGFWTSDPKPIVDPIFPVS